MVKRRIKTIWTCCDNCHVEHRWRWTAWIHGRVWLAFHWLFGPRITPRDPEKIKTERIAEARKKRELERALKRAGMSGSKAKAATADTFKVLKR